MLDLYNPCPCHPERKLKFCCGKDVVAAFSKALEMLEGGQRIKGIQTLDKGIFQFGHRDCLTGIRFALHLEDDHLAEASAICEAYAAENGNNGTAWTMRALLALEGGVAAEAIDHIQSVLETGEPPSSLLFEGILNLAIALGKIGANTAARDHFALYAQMTGDPQAIAGRYLEILRQTLSVPLPVKHDWPLMLIPDGRPWSAAAAQALHWAEKGLWRKAYQVLQPLAVENATEAVLWKNVAILAARLGYHDAELEAWGKYATCPDVHPDHAVEAEFCSLESAETFAETYDEVLISFNVSDIDSVLEQAANDPQLKQLPSKLVEPLSIRKNETPQAVFFAPVSLWGDQESVRCFDGSDVQASHLMAVIIYGKRTDRPAQLAFGVSGLPKLLETIDQMVARYPQIQEATRQATVVRKHLKFTQDFAFDRIVGLKRAIVDANLTVDAARWENYLLRELPGYRTAFLEGASFAEAVQNPKLRRRVEALLLMLECENTTLFDVRSILQRVRTALGLPAQELLSPKAVRLPELSLHQFTRLDFGQMPVRLLAWAFNTAMAFSNVNALRSLSIELERRLESPAEAEEIKRTVPLAMIYLVMAKLEGDLASVVQLLQKGLGWLPADSRQQCDWLIKAIELTVSRGLMDELPKYLIVLNGLAETDEYCLAALIKVYDILGIPAPPVGQVASQTSRPVARSKSPISPLVTNLSVGATTIGSPNPPAAPTPESKLWLPGT